jgi:integrase
MNRICGRKSPVSPTSPAPPGLLLGNRALHRTKRNREHGVEARFHLRPPKTDGSRRTMEIPPVTVKALLEHRTQQKTIRRLAEINWTEDDLVFSTRRGEPLDTSNVLHHFQEVLTKAELLKIRFYDLRHTHASLLISQGVHAKKNRRAPSSARLNSPFQAAAKII